MKETTKKKIRLSVMAVWFIEQPLFAKKMYITIVMATETAYMPRVEPIRMPLQPRESVASICARQYSAQVCARSTKRIKPRRRKRVAPANEMYFPQTKKNDSGMKNDRTIKASQ